MPDNRQPAASLAQLLTERRKAAGLRQVDLAEKLGEYQSWVQHLESGQRRIDLIELIEILEAMGFEPRKEVPRIVNDLTRVTQTLTGWFLPAGRHVVARGLKTPLQLVLLI